MRARDKPNFPRADRDGIYGCRACGTYATLRQGDRLACSRCRTAIPLVYVQETTPVEGPSKDRGTGERAQTY